MKKIFVLFFILGIGNLVIATGNETVFSLKAPSAQKVAVMGSWNNWSDQLVCVKNSQGVWSARINLPVGKYQYKFVVNDAEWITDPVNPKKGDDGLGGENSILEVVAPISSAPISSSPQPPPIQHASESTNTRITTFTVSAPDARKVSVIGSWDNWSAPAECIKTSNDKWKATLNLQPGAYDYSIIVDGEWSPLQKITVSGTRQSTASSGQATPQASIPAAPQTPSAGVLFAVDAPGANKVDIMGAWNGWSSPTECVKGSDGKWSATIKLEPGTYEYKFRKDGDYDALNKDNRKIVIGADGKEVKGNSSNAGIGSVASIQIPLEADFTKSNTFMTSDEKVMFGYIDPFANSVSIGSDFNGWDPSKTKLIRNVDGIWVATANIKEGRYGWKFVIDGQWENGDNKRLTIVKGKGGKLELLPDQPTFNTPYNSRVYFSGRFYGSAVLRNVPDGENVDTGRTRFAPLKYDLLPRMLFTVGDNITGYVEADINQYEGRFETNFNEGEVTLDEGWGRVSLFRRRRITDFNDPLRMLDPFRNTLDDVVYFTTEERPSAFKFGRKFDDVRRNTDDNYTGYTLNGWQGLYGELNFDKWKFQALGSDHIINQEDLWAARGTWTGRFLRVGSTFVHNETARGLIAERGWAGGDIAQTSQFTDNTGGYVTIPGTSDHYSYDYLVHLTPNGRNYNQLWGADIRVGSDTRHLFGEIAGRQKNSAFIAYENGDGLRPNGSANYFAWNYLNAGEYLLGGRERDLTGVFGAVYHPFSRLGLEASYRIDDGTAMTLDRNQNLVNVTPTKNTLTLKGRYKSDNFYYGIEGVHRTVKDFPNSIYQADFDNNNFTDVTVLGASDLLQFKQDLYLKLGRWTLQGNHRYRDYTILTNALQTMELKGLIGFDLTRRMQIALTGRLKSYSLPNDPTITREPNSTKRYYALGARLNYFFSKYVSMNFGFGVNPYNDEDIEEGQLFFLRSALARARRGPPAYGGGAISKALDQVLEAERILAVERRFEFNIDARF